MATVQTPLQPGVNASWLTHGGTSMYGCNGSCPVRYHTVDRLSGAYVQGGLPGSHLSCTPCVDSDGHTCGGVCAPGHYSPSLYPVQTALFDYTID